MVQDSLKELQDLKVVHTFYLGLLEKNLGHSVPVPLEIKNITGETKKPPLRLQNSSCGSTCWTWRSLRRWCATR